MGHILFSRKLNEAQKNYNANNREIVGMVEFLRHFRSYLEGACFEVVTENEILKYLFGKKDLGRREDRWLEALSDFGIFPTTLKRGLCTFSAMLCQEYIAGVNALSFRI